MKHNTHAKGREKVLAHLAMMLFAVLIAGSFTLGSMSVPFIEPGAINTVRFIGATTVIGALVLLTGGRLKPPPAPWRFAILGFLMGGYFVLMFKALKTASPVSTGAIFTLIPIMSAGFGYILIRQTTRPIVLFSLLVAGFGAVWVIFRGDIQALMGFDLGIGELFYFTGCVLHAIYGPMVQKLERGESTLEFTFWMLLAATFWIVLYGFGDVVQTRWLALPAIVWITICYLAVVTTAGTFSLTQYAIVRLPASKVFAYGYLTPGFIIVLEGLAGHGWVSLPVAMGAFVTVLGLVIMALAPDS